MKEKNNISSNFKTKKCTQYFDLGICLYGMRCQFSHHLEKDNNHQSIKRFSYKRTLEILASKSINLEHDEELFKLARPRLKTFEAIANKKVSFPNLIEDVFLLKKTFEIENPFSLVR